MIKLRAFVNIRGYIDVEGDGKVWALAHAERLLKQEVDRLSPRLTVLHMEIVDDEPIQTPLGQ